MKHVSLTILRGFVLLVGLMVWQTKTAEAHGIHHSATYETAVQSAQDTASKTEITVVKSAASASQEDNCKDGCCSSMGSCCSVAAISSHSPDENIIREAFAIGLPELSLPQSPPSSLLRPPRFFA